MAIPSSILSITENMCADHLDHMYRMLSTVYPWYRALLQKQALAFEESWSAWDAVTSHQVRASNLPLIYVDVILKLISEERKASYEEFLRLEILVLYGPGAAVFKWEQMHYGKVGRFIEKLMVLLRSSTMRAEEDVFKQTEAVKRMYEAEVQGRVLQRSWRGLHLEELCSLMLPAFISQESLEQYFSAISTLLYAVVVSSVSLLVFVYRYLTGYVDKGGTLTCSSGSSQFRAIFISVVLFDGAYVWIKFRDAASTSSGGKRGSREDTQDRVSGPLTISKSRKIEAKYRPPGQYGRQIYLSVCDGDEEAAIKKRIAAFLYGRDKGQLARGDGLLFQVPLTLREEGEGLSVEEKRVWVRDKFKEVYQSFTNEKAINPASRHPSEDAAGFFSFLNEHLLGSPAQEIPVSDAVPGSEDVCNGAVTSNGLCTGEDGVPQEFVFGEGAMVSCFLPAQEGMQKLDVATSAGVDFGMAESKPNVFAMMVIGCKDKEIQEWKQKHQKKKQKIKRKKQKIEREKQKYQEEKQKNEELKQILQERESRIAKLEREIELLRALTWVDPQMKELDLDGLA